MTPAWDWARFDALQAKLRRNWLRAETRLAQSQAMQLRGRVADAQHALENGRPVTMRKEVYMEHALTVTTPDEFVDAWEQGWRP